MKVTVLGCGSSGGVPLIGGNWGKCDPANPRNRRTRVSVLVEQGDTTLIVDTSPDMRQQLLACDLKKLDAVLYTHAHADHCHGIDDLRSINWLAQKPVDVYADARTLAELENRFAYIFAVKGQGQGSYYKPAVAVHEITGAFNVGDIAVMPFVQEHGKITSLGFRFGDFAYSTDVHRLDGAAFDALRGVKTWLVDCVRETPHPTHSHLEQTLQWIERVNPERAFLTHMNQDMDYETLCNKLPRGVEPAYDGMIIEC
ncbi:MAG: MBL fold metallo-hydrolase [Alphaproteobacteria bacterium]|nr:MBL fold metallo-hydrolase [Alphaproteobacteria bacterium]